MLIIHSEILLIWNVDGGTISEPDCGAAHKTWEGITRAGIMQNAHPCFISNSIHGTVSSTSKSIYVFVCQREGGGEGGAKYLLKFKPEDGLLSAISGLKGDLSYQAEHCNACKTARFCLSFFLDAGCMSGQSVIPFSTNSVYYFRVKCLPEHGCVLIILWLGLNPSSLFIK